jgi:hypothetical protein
MIANIIGYSLLYGGFFLMKNKLPNLAMLFFLIAFFVFLDELIKQWMKKK